MSWFANLRILAYCRRAIRALESIAESQRILSKMAENEWSSRNAPKPMTQTSFSTFDHDAASKRWEEEQSIKHGS